MLESRIEKRVCEYAESKGVNAYKWVAPGHKNVPDRIFIGNNVIWFCEFKAPGKEPRKSQVREIERLRSKGHMVFVIDNTEDGKRMVDTMV